MPDPARAGAVELAQSAGAESRDVEMLGAAADLLVFVVDGRAGITGLDEEIAGILRKSGQPTLLAVNKVDSAGQDTPVGDAYRLGFAPVLTVSAEHGRGVAELLEQDQRAR